MLKLGHGWYRGNVFFFFCGWWGQSVNHENWTSTKFYRRGRALDSSLRQWAMAQGSVNVRLEHHPIIGNIISNIYLKVMVKIPKKGHLPTPVTCHNNLLGKNTHAIGKKKATANIKMSAAKISFEHSHDPWDVDQQCREVS